jgi:hypothetical protein
VPRQGRQHEDVQGVHGEDARALMPAEPGVARPAQLMCARAVRMRPSSNGGVCSGGPCVQEGNRVAGRVGCLGTSAGACSGRAPVHLGYLEIRQAVTRCQSDPGRLASQIGQWASVWHVRPGGLQPSLKLHKHEYMHQEVLYRCWQRLVMPSSSVIGP